MGGLPRRATFIDQEKHWNQGILILDSGNLAADKPLDEQALEPAGSKAELILKAMDYMGYGATAVGEMDLYLGIDRLEKLSTMTKVRFLSANLTDSQGKNLFEPYRIFRIKGIRVGVIGLTAPPSNISMFERRTHGAVVQDPLQAARKAIGDIRNKCDLLVILSNIGYQKDVRLAREVPGIDVLVSGGSKRFMKRPVKEGKTLITSGYYEGRAVGKLVIHLNGEIRGWVTDDELKFLDSQIKTTETKTGTPAGKRHYEDLLNKRKTAGELTMYEPDMVNLDPSFADDSTVADMISDYRRKLTEEEVSSPPAPAGSGARESYTGPETCSRCHESRYRFWLTTGHARAFESLSPKNAGSDPDCLPCHVTGYMRRTGYWPKAPREDLQGVQCEVCHGVGSLHASAPDLYSLVPTPVAPQCLDCHTPEQDGDFDYLRDKKLVCAEM